MKKTRSRTSVFAGLAVAVVGAVVVLVYAHSVTSHVGGEAAVSAVVATSDIPAGTTWEAAGRLVASRPVPVSLRPVTGITSMNQLAGTTSVRRVAKGEVITSDQFGRSAFAPDGGLEIPPGHNAVTVNLSPPQGVAGYVQAGDLVNIYTTLSAQRTGGAITKLLLSNVQVLANRSAGAPSSASVASSAESVLTLALTPAQAEKFIFAKENGSLWFGLVRPGDKPASTSGRTAQNVLN